MRGRAASPESRSRLDAATLELARNPAANSQAALSPRVLSPRSPLSPRSVTGAEEEVSFGVFSGDPLSDPSTETFAGECSKCNFFSPPLRGITAGSLAHSFASFLAAMSAIFDGYEKEFLELNSAITRKTALIPTLQRGTWLSPSSG